MVKLDAIENFEEFFNKYSDDIAQHYLEYSEHFSGNKTIDLDVELHQSLIDSGVLHCFKILSDDVYAGYISLSVSPSMLIKGDIEVTVNHVFLKKEFRGKSIAKETLEILEDFLWGEGLATYNVALPDTDGHRAFAEHLSMKPTAVTYIKELRG